MSLYINLSPADHREYHRLVFSDRHIFHQAAPDRLVEFRHKPRQLFQFRDESLELPPADTALPDVCCHLIAFCDHYPGLAGLIPSRRPLTGMDSLDKPPGLFV